MRRAGLLGLFLLLAACGGAGTNACAPEDTCLRAGIISDPGSLDPARAFVKQDQTIILDLLTGLTTFDAHGRVVPGLAEHWEISPDQLSWTFHLREAVWSDGVPITADDVVFSLRRIVDPATAASYATLLYPLENAARVHAAAAPPESLGVAAPDPRTIVIRLAHPTPYLPALLTHYGLVPVPPHAIARHGDGWTAPGRFVSSGAFLLEDWRLGERISLVRNPRFFAADEVCLDRVDYFPSPNATLAERRVRRGELDWHPTFDAARAAYLRSPRGLPDYVRTHPFVDMVYLAFNLRDPALADVRVRQALTLAIDRDFIAGRLLTAGHEPTFRFVPDALAGAASTASVAPPWAALDFESRLEQASALLAEAGYSPERPLRIEIKSVLGNGVPAAIAADYRLIGVDVSLSRAEVAVYFNDLILGDFQVAYTDWIGDYPDPTTFLNLLRTGNPANYGAFSDPEYDLLLARAEAETDPAARAALLADAERRLLLSAAIAPIFVAPALNLVDPRITGWHDNLDDVHLMRYACFADAADVADARAQ